MDVIEAHARRLPPIDDRWTVRPHTEEAPETDELGLHLPLELVQLGDPTGLDELAQTRRDARPDSAQLLHATLGDELGNRRLRLANRLRSAPVGARRVEAGSGEVEERRKRFQLLGDRRVVEGARHGLVSLAP